MTEVEWISQNTRISIFCVENLIKKIIRGVMKKMSLIQNGMVSAPDYLNTTELSGQSPFQFTVETAISE